MVAEIKSFHQIYQILMYSIIIALGSPCIIFICFTIISKRRLWTIINTIVVAEAISDIPLVLITPIIELYRILTNSQNKVLCIISEVINLFCFSWTFASFIVIGVLRYCVICHGVKIKRNKRTVFFLMLPSIVNAGVRTVGSVFMFGLFNSCLHPRINYDSGSNDTEPTARDSKSIDSYNHANAIDIASTIFWSMILTCMNYRVFQKIKSSSRNVNSFSIDQQDHRRKSSIRTSIFGNRDVVTSVSCSIHLIVFVLAYSIVIFYNRFFTISRIYDKNYHSIYVTIQFVLTLSDPVIYVAFSEQFRRILTNIFFDRKLVIKRTLPT